jgi:hypothetical protein
MDRLLRLLALTTVVLVMFLVAGMAHADINASVDAVVARDLSHLPQSHRDAGQKLSPVWLLAPIAGQLLDGWTTQRHLDRFGRDGKWPQGEMNPLLRPSAHKGGAQWYAVKGAYGILQAWNVSRVNKKYGPDTARKVSILSTGVSVGLAGFNEVQIRISK